jgi:hypothetical protein
MLNKNFQSDIIPSNENGIKTYISDRINVVIQTKNILKVSKNKNR